MGSLCAPTELSVLGNEGSSDTKCSYVYYRSFRLQTVQPIGTWATDKVENPANVEVQVLLLIICV